jgi:hypothetical protein
VRRFKIPTPLVPPCEPRTLLDEPCHESECWGARGHLGTHANETNRWTVKSDYYRRRSD